MMSEFEFFGWAIICATMWMWILLLKDSRAMLKRQVEIVEALNKLVNSLPDVPDEES